jgi:uncharacterized damage-inducible protein DinB
MITPGYVQLMAKYNAEMNRRWYGAAAGLSDAQRKEERGAFWHTLHGTLCHILWGDRQWMSRFDGWEKPAVAIKQSWTLYDDFDALRAARVEADAGIEAWAGRMTQGEIDGELVWFSGAMQRELRRAKAPLLVHFFNHQAHHRGQAHALLTAMGAETGDTDLPFVL